MSWAQILMVIIGGASGALLRYFAVLFLPMPIFTVNILGSFLIGFTYYRLTNQYPHLLPLINTGFLGGLTTFSSFALEALQMYQNAGFFKVFLYILFKMVISILLCYIGYRLAIQL